jgi:hypothetical protein
MKDKRDIHRNPTTSPTLLKTSMSASWRQSLSQHRGDSFTQELTSLMV